MKAALFSAISAMRGETAEKFIDDLSEMGFDGAEMATIRTHLSPLIYKTKADRKKLKEYADSRGIEICDLDMRSSLINPVKNVRERELVVYRVLAEMAVDLDCPIVKVDHGSGHSYKETGMLGPIPDVSREQQKQWLIEQLKECVLIAEEYGIMCGLHNHVFGTIRENFEIMREIGSEHIGLIIDADNATKFHENVNETVRMIGKDKILIGHIKDHKIYPGRVWMGEGHDLLGRRGMLYAPMEEISGVLGVEEGIVDNEGFVKTLKEIGWDGYLSVEAVDKEQALKGLKWIRSHS